MKTFLNVLHLLAPDSEQNVFTNFKCTILGICFFTERRSKKRNLTKGKGCFIGGFGGKVFNTMIINKLT